jgi:hypothetical protein
VGHGVEFLEYTRDGFKVCEVDAQCVNLDGRVALGDEWCVFILETLCVAGEQDDVVDAFGSELGSDVVADAWTGAEGMSVRVILRLRYRG